jgi:2-hydroxy-3-oxopropionate reductase
MSERVGFIGLGVMGAPMARNLVAAGHEVVVYNRSPGPREALVAAGARAVETPADVARAAPVVITMLSDDRAVRDVVLGDGGVLDAAAPGSLLIDASTVTPALARELAERASQRDVAVLDAPVSGGDAGARDGTLSIMVGGEAADVERARPLLEALGSSIVHVGPAGAGQVVKSCNQLLIAITIAAVGEALVLGSKLGVAPDTILDVLSRGTAGNRVMEVKRRNLLEHAFAPGFRVDLHHKDLDIALRGAGEAGVPLALTALVQQMFNELRAQGRGAEDHTALLAVVEAHAEHRIAASAPQSV